jgi:hypothetical protein
MRVRERTHPSRLTFWLWMSLKGKYGLNGMTYGEKK